MDNGLHHLELLPCMLGVGFVCRHDDFLASGEHVLVLCDGDLCFAINDGNDCIEGAVFSDNPSPAATGCSCLRLHGLFHECHQIRRLNARRPCNVQLHQLCLIRITANLYNHGSK